MGVARGRCFLSLVVGGGGVCMPNWESRWKDPRLTGEVWRFLGRNQNSPEELSTST